MAGPAPDRDLCHSQRLSRCSAAAMAEPLASSIQAGPHAASAPRQPHSGPNAFSRTSISSALSRVRGPSLMRLRSRARGCSAMAQHSRRKRSRAGMGCVVVHSFRTRNQRLGDGAPLSPALGSQGVGIAAGAAGAYQERSPLGMLRSAPNESYSESSVTGFGFVKSSSSRS